jgi:hypothetical protein
VVPRRPRVPGEVWWAYRLLDEYMYTQTHQPEPRPRPQQQQQQQQQQPAPPFTHASALPPRSTRAQPTCQPPAVDWTLWRVYAELVDWVYRQSLSDGEAAALPTLDEVMAYGADWDEWERGSVAASGTCHQMPPVQPPTPDG